MKLPSKHGHAALMLAVAGAAGLASLPRHVAATVFTTSTSVENNIEASGPFAANANDFSFFQAGTFPAFGVLDFSSTALGIPAGFNVASVNSGATLTLGNFTSSFSKPSTFDVYLSNNNAAVGTLVYQPTATPLGVGTQLNTLFPLGNITYTSGGTGTSTVTPLTLSSAAETYLASEINGGGNLRIVMVPTNSADVEFVSPKAATGMPALSLDLNTAAITAANSAFTINGGTKAQTIDLGRIAAGVSSSTTVTVTNSGTDPGLYSLIGGTAGGTGTLVAGGSGAVGVLPVPPSGGTSNVTVTINPANVTPGSASPATPATATVTIHDQTNSADADSIVTLKADQVVASRIIDNAGATGNVVQYGKILGGTSAAAQLVTLDTENTNSLDYTSNSLTSVTLPGSSVTAVLSGTSNTTLDTDAATLAADPGNASTLFNDGSVIANRNVTFTAGTTQGGLYQTSAFYDGYLVVPLVNSDTALNAVTTPTARVYMEADVYQPASVSGSANGTAFVLTNAKHTTNTVNATLGDIGARSSAQVTAIGTLVAQAGFSVDPGFVNNTVIADGASITAANFNSAGKWNGTYHGTLPVTLQNDQSITGAHPNDLGTTNFAVSAVVTGNSGNASVNVLAGGSLAGYSIPRGSGKNSTVSLLGGSSITGNTVSVAWSDASSALAASDKATLTENASDTLVVQMSYDPSFLGNGLELAYTNGSGVNVLAVDGNSDGGSSAAETLGAFPGTATLGSYGIDPVNHTVWAVVNHVGAFEAFQRKIGDSNGDGSVDLSDLNAVLNNLGTGTALWSKGNFDGAATIDLTDLNDVLNNLGTSLPGGAVVPNVPVTPEPTTLGIAGFGIAGMLLRRRRNAR